MMNVLNSLEMKATVRSRAESILTSMRGRCAPFTVRAVAKNVAALSPPVIRGCGCRPIRCS